MDGAPTDARLRASLAKRIVLALVGAGLLVAIVYFGPRDSISFWEAVSAAIFGALVATAELVTRYRDDPAAALISAPAIIYVSVNAIAALGAYYLIKTFGWTFGATGAAVDITQVLTAGFGSASLFRSSLFNVTAGDQVVGVGPSAVLAVILGAADRAVDRQRAVVRSAQATRIMRGVSFERSADALIAFTVATMQNVTAEEAQSVQNRIAQLRDRRNDDIPDSIKSYILGVSLLTLTGGKVLEGVAAQIREAFPEPASNGLDQDLQQIPGSMTEPRPKTADTLIVDCLARSGSPVSIQTLQSQIGLDYRAMTHALKDLLDRDLIVVEGQTVALKT